METEKQEKKTILLIGDKTSKRSLFFRKAAEDLGVLLRIVDWDSLKGQFDLDEFQGAAVKIDPPSYSIVRLCQMKEQLDIYQKKLHYLEKAGCQFLNPPELICRLLDKRETNRFLKTQGLLVTTMFPEEIKTAFQLEEVLREKRCYSAFVKPRYFSGAAGVAAFRMHPAGKSKKLYTSCRFRQGRLINTKKLVCLEDPEEIRCLLDHLLSLECVVERWHPKADFHGKTFDLRIVFQFGHIAYMIARQSDGPITNLHLNNQARNIGELGLDQTVICQIGLVCKQAYEAYSKTLDGGVNMLGIDLLLEKGTLKPRVIELNGQGDCIYRDIYGENRIYQEQTRFLSGI